MFIHTGNHYFCPITHITDITPTLLNVGVNLYDYIDYSSLNNYSSIFNFNNQSNGTYGWSYVIGSGYDLYDNMAYGGNYFGLTNSYNNCYSHNNNYLYGGTSGLNNTNPFVYENITPRNTTPANYSITNPNQTQKTFSSIKTTNTYTSQQKINNETNKAFAKSIADNAENYIGYNEKDGSFHKFSNNTEWCADFVTYVVKESYQQKGRQIPKGFGSWRCENLKQWAINNHKFLQTAGRENKASLIAKNVKPGDIIILRENGASHTGIVKSVNKETGEIGTIEGNVTASNGVDSVVYNNYSPYNAEISGFIQLV